MFTGKLKSIQLLLLVFCFTLIGIRVFEAPIYNSGNKRDFIRGDAYSDKNVHSAVQYFYHNGFDSTAYLPVYDYDSVGDPEYTVYTHYPALPDLLAGGYALLLDTTDMKPLRIFPVLLSVGWFFLIFHFLSRVLPHRQKAFLSACVIVLSTYFLGWADTLHKHTYEEAFKWAFVYFLFLYYERFFRNKFFLTGLGVFFVIIANISYEPIAYLAVVVVGFSLIYRQRIFTLETITLGLAAIAGFGIHFLQVVEHFGSFQAAKDDLLSAAVVRTTGEATDKMASERNITWGDYLLMPYDLLNRVERYFLIPGWAMLVLGYLGMRFLKQESLKAYQIGLTLLIASLIWAFIMPQHFIVHTFTTKQIGLFYGFIAGYGLWAYWTYCREAFRERKWPLMIMHILLIAYILVMFLSQQVWPMYVKYGFGLLS